jgi:phosphate transport system substrate-binding protein
MNKIAKTVIAVVAVFALSACSNGGGADTSSADGPITVISREGGSGTKSAFEELFELLDADGNGLTVASADVTSSTAVMLTSVQTDVNAIGYISLGSLSDSVKALAIDGVAATRENAASGAYKIVRPFTVTTLGAPDGIAKEFIDYILSPAGRTVIDENGYIASGTGSDVELTATGNLSVCGSSSVAPVMEKLKEAYESANKNAKLEIQQSNSSTGISNTIDGTCKIGMSSRDLKDSEKEKGAIETKIATDGIAVIVNNENPVTDLTKEQVKAIFAGDATTWKDVN